MLKFIRPEWLIAALFLAAVIMAAKNAHSAEIIGHISANVVGTVCLIPAGDNINVYAGNQFFDTTYGNEVLINF